MRKRIMIALPSELLNRARQKAAAEGRTLESLVEDGLRLVLGRRVMPRISAAKGGVRPGIDLADSAALQEMDDLDVVERMKLGR